MIANIVVFVTVGLWVGLVFGCFYAICKVLYKYRNRNNVNRKTINLLENTLKSKDIDFSDIEELSQHNVQLYIKALKSKLYSHYLVGGIRGIFCIFFPKQFYIFNDLEEELEEVTNICLNMNSTEMSLTVLSMLSKIKPPEEFDDDNYDNDSGDSDESKDSKNSGESNSKKSNSSKDSKKSNESKNSVESKNSDKSSSHKSNDSKDSNESKNSDESKNNIVTKPELVSKVLFTFIETFADSYILERMKRSILA